MLLVVGLLTRFYFWFLLDVFNQYLARSYENTSYIHCLPAQCALGIYCEDNDLFIKAQMYFFYYYVICRYLIYFKVSIFKMNTISFRVGSITRYRMPENITRTEILKEYWIHITCQSVARYSLVLLPTCTFWYTALEWLDLSG